MSVNKTRGIIIVLSILALAASLAIENKMVALILMSICISGAVFILYRHLGELTDISADNPKMKTLKGVTIFNIAVLVVCVLAAILIGTDIWKISENGEKYFAATIIAAVIFFSGNIAPKLPYSKHTGLRLPWTVTDEETWVVAHRVLAYVSIPLGIAYIAGVSVIENFEILTLATIILWVGIPGGLSYLFFHKKCGGNNKTNRQF